ncbi:MAG: DUF5801 repeats-in-toxin domain-containing protein [Pseudomonadota bacterium]
MDSLVGWNDELAALTVDKPEAGEQITITPGVDQGIDISAIASLDAQFYQTGSNLWIVFEDGAIIVVEGYFEGGTEEVDGTPRSVIVDGETFTGEEFLTAFTIDDLPDEFAEGDVGAPETQQNGASFDDPSLGPLGDDPNGIGLLGNTFLSSTTNELSEQTDAEDSTPSIGVISPVENSEIDEAASEDIDGDSVFDTPLSVTGGLGVDFGANGEDSGADGEFQDAPTGINSGNRSIVFDAADVTASIPLESGGEPLTFVLSQGGTVLTAFADGTPVFEVRLFDDGTGSYQFTLFQSLDHPVENTADTLALSFGFTANDSDDDSASGTFTVSIIDDVPSIGEGDEAPETTRVDEAGIGSASVSKGRLVGTAEDNSDGKINASVMTTGDGNRTAQIDPVTGQQVLQFINTGETEVLFEFRVGNANGETVAAGTVGANTRVFLTGLPDLAPGTVLQPVFSIDGGDTWQNAGGTETLSAVDAPTVVFDFGGAAFTASQGDLNIDWGADNFDDPDTIDGQDTPDGIGDREVRFRDFDNTGSPVRYLDDEGEPFALTSSGKTISYSVSDDGTQLFAFIDSADDGEGFEDGTDELVFTVTLSDDGTGSYSFELFGNIDHIEDIDDLDIEIDFAFTAVDSDGDTADGTFRVEVVDDEPSIDENAVQDGVVEEEQAAVVGAGNEDTGPNPEDADFRSGFLGLRFNDRTMEKAEGTLGIDWGADDTNPTSGGALGDRSVAFDPELDGSTALTSRGDAIRYELSSDGTVLTAIATDDSTAATRTVFTVTLSDDDSGSYEFTLVDTLDHPTDAQDSENSLALTFSFIATDSDGDTVDSSFDVSVIDDRPFTLGTIFPRYVEEEALTGGNLDGLELGASATGLLNIYWGGDDTDTIDGERSGFLVQDDPTISGQRSVVFSDDGNRPITAEAAADFISVADGNGDDVDLASLSSNGEALTFRLANNGTILIADADGQRVFTVELSDDANPGAPIIGAGSYTFNLFDTIDHPIVGDDPSDEDALNFTFNFTARDGDGDVTTGNFEVRVVDDSPIIDDAADPIALTVDEDDIRTVGIDLPGQNSGSTGTSPNDDDDDGSFTGDPRFVDRGPANVSGSLASQVSFGADDGQVGFTIIEEAAARSALDALNLQSNGQSLSFDVDPTSDGSVVYGYIERSGSSNSFTFGNGGDRLVFRLTLNEDGDFEFELFDQLDHVEGNQENTDLQGGADAIDFGSIIQATDGDGDTVTLTDRFSIEIRDDVPVAALESTGAWLTVDESARRQTNGGADDISLGSNNSNLPNELRDFVSTNSLMILSAARDDLTSLGDSAAGADEPANYFLSLTDVEGNPLNNVESGLKDSETGDTIFLFTEGDLVVGRSNDQAGAPSFALEIDNFGDVTIAQFRSIQHDDVNDYNESNDNGFNSGDNQADNQFPNPVQQFIEGIYAKMTITDADGDTDSNTIALTIRVLDDGPSAGNRFANDRVLLEDEDVDGVLGNPGGPGDNSFSTPVDATGFLVGDFGSDSNGEFVLRQGVFVSDGAGSFVSRVSADGSILTIAQDDVDILQVTITDPATGAYTVEQLQPLRHLTQNGTSQDNTENNTEFTIRYRVVDGDDDYADGEFRINIDDDTPIVGDTVAPAWFEQDFGSASDAASAGLFDASNGHVGTVTVVPDGTGGINTPDGGNFAILMQGGTPGSERGPFTRFDGYKSDFQGGFTASVAIYLDTGWSASEGFDYSVAASGQDGNHLRDFIFHVTKDTSTGKLLVGGSNNTNFDPREDLETLNNTEITSSGWYTFEHVFRDFGDGTLAVDLNVYDSTGTLLFTETRNNANDLLSTEVGGNRYGWFTNIDVDGGIAVDDLTLSSNAGIAIVDEDDLSDGNNDVVAGDEVVVDSDTLVTGDLAIAWGADDADTATAARQDAPSGIGDRSVTFDATIMAPEGLTSDGEQITYEVINGGTALIARADGRDVFVVGLNDDDSGNYTFRLLDKLDHSTDDTEDNINLEFGFVATDSDGDTATGSFTVSVDDDSPDARWAGSHIEVDEATQIDTVVPGQLQFKPGADGAAVTSVSVHTKSGFVQRFDQENPAGSQIADLEVGGFTVTATTETVAGVTTITGTVEDGNDNPAFKIVVQPDGIYEYTQFVAFDHPDEGESGADDKVALRIDFTVTDGDGDTDTAGAYVRVADDTPIVDWTDSERTNNFRIISDDETVKDSNDNPIGNLGFGYNTSDGAESDSKEFHQSNKSLPISFGADGGTVVWNAATSEALSGVAADAPIGFEVEDGTGDLLIKQDQGGDDLVIVARVTLDPATGAYTYTQLANLLHDDKGDNVEDDATFNLGFTVEDGDGDIVEDSLPLIIDDDSPTIRPFDTNPDRTIIAEGTVENGTSNDNGQEWNRIKTIDFSTGADGAAEGGAVAWDPLTSGPADGSAVGFSFETNDDGTLIISQDHGGAGKVVVAEVTMNSDTGRYEVIEKANVLHTGTNGDSASLTLKFTVTDGDGDTVVGERLLVLRDDTPILSGADTVTVSEAGTQSVADQDDTFSATLDGVSYTFAIAQGSSDLFVSGPSITDQTLVTLDVLANLANGEVTARGNFSIDDPNPGITGAPVSANAKGEFIVNIGGLNTGGNYKVKFDNQADADAFANFAQTLENQGLLNEAFRDNGRVSQTGNLNIAWGADGQDVSTGNFKQDTPGGTGDRSVTFQFLDQSKIAENIVYFDDGERFYLTSGGADLVYKVNSDGTKLTATAGAGGATVFVITLEDDDTGAYRFELMGPLDHVIGRDNKDLEFDVKFAATDADGDTVNGSFEITVDDDVPSTSAVSLSVDASSLNEWSHIEFDTMKVQLDAGTKPNVLEAELHQGALNGANTVGYNSNGTKDSDDDNRGDTLLNSQLTVSNGAFDADNDIQQGELATTEWDIGGTKSLEGGFLDPLLADLVDFQAFRYRNDATGTPETFDFSNGDNFAVATGGTANVAVAENQRTNVVTDGNSGGFQVGFGIDRGGSYTGPKDFGGDGGNNKAIDGNEFLLIDLKKDGLVGTGLSFAVDRIGNDSEASVVVDFFTKSGNSYTKVGSQIVDFDQTGTPTGPSSDLANVGFAFDAIAMSSADGGSFSPGQIEFNLRPASVAVELDLVAENAVDFGADGPADGGGFALSDDTSALADLGLKSGGVQINYEVNGGVLTATAGVTVIFTAALTADGKVNFTQFETIDDQSGGSTDVINLPIGFTATDGDGDSVQGTFTVAVEPKTIVVDADGNGDFLTIQAAIDDPNTLNGDIIIVKGGADDTHAESGIDVTKSVTIKADKAGTILDTGTETGFLIDQKAVDGVGDTVRIEGFDIKADTASTSTYGIYYQASRDADAKGSIEIVGTDVSGFSQAGIYISGGGEDLRVLVNGDDGTGSKSTVTDNGYGFVGSSDGKADLQFFEFLGSLTLKDLDVVGTNVVSPGGWSKDGVGVGINIQGYLDVDSPSKGDLVDAPIGTVVFDDVSVTGDYAKPLVYILGYNDFTGLSFINTVIGDAGTQASTGLLIDPYLGAGAFGGFIDDPDNISVLDLSGIAFAGGTYSFGSGQNLIIGVPTDETINGTEFGDVILGSFGDDTINGFGGDDVIIGGLGADAKSGGDGKDTFVLNDLSSADTILDYTENEDKIDLTELLNGVTITDVDPNNVTDYVKIENGVLKVDRDGLGGSETFKDAANLFSDGSTAVTTGNVTIIDNSDTAAVEISIAAA